MWPEPLPDEEWLAGTDAGPGPGAGFAAEPAGGGGDVAENDCEFECVRTELLGDVFGPGIALAERIEPPALLPTLPGSYRAGCWSIPCAAPVGDPIGAELLRPCDWLRENCPCASGGLLFSPFFFFDELKMAMMLVLRLGWRRGRRDFATGDAGC